MDNLSNLPGPTSANGHPIIYRQHNQLERMIESLHTSIEHGHDRVTLENVLAQMLEYARDHFPNEERLLASNLTPTALHKHQQQHDAFLRQALELRIDLLAGRADLDKAVLKFLQDWVTYHNLQEDKTALG